MSTSLRFRYVKMAQSKSWNVHGKEGATAMIIAGVTSTVCTYKCIKASYRTNAVGTDEPHEGDVVTRTQLTNFTPFTLLNEHFETPIIFQAYNHKRMFSLSHIGYDAMSLFDVVFSTFASGRDNQSILYKKMDFEPVFAGYYTGIHNARMYHTANFTPTGHFYIRNEQQYENFCRTLGIPSTKYMVQFPVLITYAPTSTVHTLQTDLLAKQSFLSLMSNSSSTVKVPTSDTVVASDATHNMDWMARQTNRNRWFVGAVASFAVFGLFALARSDKTHLRHQEYAAWDRACRT